MLEFYARHYPRQPDGRILFVPAQALETLGGSQNPTPEVAGLHFVLPQLLAMPAATIGESRLAAWRKLLSELPPVPRRTEQNKTFVLPAEAFPHQTEHGEPELYAVFPSGSSGLAVPAWRWAWRRSAGGCSRGTSGGSRTISQAALLGLADDTRRMLVDRLSRSIPESRFPAFWGPNFELDPGPTHGGATR